LKGTRVKAQGTKRAQDSRYKVQEGQQDKSRKGAKTTWVLFNF